LATFVLHLLIAGNGDLSVQFAALHCCQLRGAPRGCSTVARVEVIVPADAFVIRFRPFEPGRVLASAEKEYRRAGHYRLSVFADTAEPDERAEAVVKRLLQVAELDGIPTATNPKYTLCTAAGKLLDRGFVFHKYDEDDPDPVDELDEHYSIDLGEEPTLGDVARFLEPFGPATRRQS
jgi:hypothetical protein